MTATSGIHLLESSPCFDMSIMETEMAEEMTTYEELRVLSTSLLIKMPLRQLLSSCQEELLLENKREIINTNKYIQLEIPFDEW